MGVIGSAIKWNFTKVSQRECANAIETRLCVLTANWCCAQFLVNRQGVPVKRYGPTDKPLDFEADIVALLGQ
jgi:glutathione peroxidase-family protein